MTAYRYRALDGAGNPRRGLRVAPDEQSLEEFLDQRGWTPLSIKREERFRRRPIQHRKTLARFFRNLRVFLGGGMDLVPALRQVEDWMEEKPMRACVQTLVDDLEAGRSLGDSMQGCQPYFPVEAHRICAVGERTGNLESACRQLSRFYHSQHEFLERTYNLLLYPVIVLGTGAVVLGFLFTVVLPRLRGLFRNDPGELPLLTQSLFVVSGLVQGWGLWVVLGLIACGGYLMGRLFTSRWGRRTRRALLARSTLYRRIKMQLFCLAVAMATGVGFNVGEALQLGKDVMGNPVLAERMGQVKCDVESGQALTDSLARHGFDTLPMDSLAAGEQSGNLSEVFSFQAELLREEVEESLQRLVTVLEPALILGMTLFVGLVLLAVLWPVVTMTTAP